MNKDIKAKILADKGKQKVTKKSETGQYLVNQHEVQTRGDQRAYKDISREKIKYQVVELYLNNTPIAKIAEKFHYTTGDITNIIDDHIMNLANTRSAQLLEGSRENKIYPVLEKLKKIEVLNEPFLAKLSPNESLTLTEEEALFAWIYVHKGDSKEAVEMATLDDGLLKEQAITYKRGIFSRALYLQNKPNVSQYIKELREAKYFQEDVTKQYIQRELLEQIEYVKQRNDKKDAIHLRQLIELLGKTIGAFTERVEIQEVNPSKSLDLLIEMAKEASVKELEKN